MGQHAGQHDQHQEVQRQGISGDLQGGGPGARSEVSRTVM